MKVTIAKPKAGVSLSPENWRLHAAFLRIELRRHDLTFREIMIAELILDKTYGWGRTEVVFPQLSFFADLTGIDESDLTKIIDRLRTRKVIRVVRVKGKPTYSLLPDTESWKALPRVTRETMAATLNLLREWNGLLPYTSENLHAEMGKSPVALPIDEPAGQPTLNLT